MIVAVLMLLPFLAALAMWLLRGRLCRSILISAALIQAVLAARLLGCGEVMLHIGGVKFGSTAGDIGKWVLMITSVLFVLVSLQLPAWLTADGKAGKVRHGETGMPGYLLATLVLVFVGTMNLTALARDFGMLWVAVEATTLASAPLINFHRSKSSLEAMWKYLLLCSLGIGLALFGTMLLSAGLPAGAALDFDAVTAVDPQWFKAAFIFCFAGYGLKTGLAPFHSWLPDAHSEAPAPVSALLSGSLLNCALIGLLRIRDAAPEELLGFCNGFFICFGMLSLVIAACFIIKQKDFKRMLAYSSVEHMGLIALMFGFMLPEAAKIHMLFHSMCKMMLFLIAGNLVLAYGVRRVDAVRGAFSRFKRNGKLWLPGVLLLCGVVPSPLFFTEWALVQRAGLLTGGVVLLLLLVIFCAMSDIVLKMSMGDADEPELPEIDAAAEKLTVIPALTMVLVMGSGLWFCVQVFLSLIN